MAWEHGSLHHSWRRRRRPALIDISIAKDRTLGCEEYQKRKCLIEMYMLLANHVVSVVWAQEETDRTAKHRGQVRALNLLMTTDIDNWSPGTTQRDQSLGIMILFVLLRITRNFPTATCCDPGLLSNITLSNLVKPWTKVNVFSTRRADEWIFRCISEGYTDLPSVTQLEWKQHLNS